MTRVLGVLRSRARTVPPWTDTTNPMKVGSCPSASGIRSCQGVEEARKPREISEAKAAGIGDIVGARLGVGVERNVEEVGGAVVDGLGEPP
jgi:hypothetical protein